MQRRFLTLALLVLTAVPRAPVSAQTTTVRLGTGVVEANAQVYYAEELGLFKKHGLDVQVVQLRSGPSQMAAVAGGDLQIGVGNLVSLASAQIRGLPFTIIAPGALFDASAPTTLLAEAPNAPYRTAKDLEGKTVTGISVGGLDQLAIDAWIDKSGGDLSTVKYVETPPSAMVEALATGRVAAAAINDPEFSAALSAHKIKTLANAYTAIAPLFMQTGFFTTKAWAAKNPDALKRFSDAVVEAGEWASKHPDESRAILEKDLKTKVASTRVKFATKLDPALIQPLLDSAAHYKLLPRVVSASDLIWSGMGTAAR
jgi:NitT/TauT family transport system substrate-binding protein